MIFTQRGILLVLPFSLWIAFFGGGQTKQTNRAGLNYDEGGIFRITLDVPLTRRVELLGESRAFIWDHWNQHRRGKLQIIGQTIEGQVKVQKIVIEPDASGHWHIRAEEQAEERNDAHRAKPLTRTDEYDEVRRTDINTGNAMPTSQERKTGTYRLLLTNSSKQIEWTL